MFNNSVSYTEEDRQKFDEERANNGATEETVDEAEEEGLEQESLLDELVGEEEQAEEDVEEAEETDEEPSKDNVVSKKDVVEVEYKDLDGRDIVARVNVKKDLPDILTVARKGVEALNYVQAIAPVIEQFKNSRILQDVYYYLTRGYSDDDIKKGLPSIWMKEASDNGVEEAQEENLEEGELSLPEIQRRIDKIVEDKVKKIISPLQNEFNSAKARSEIASIESHNATLLRKGLENLGYSPEELGETERIAIDNSFAAIYPGLDPHRYRLTPAQINVILKDALSRGGVNAAKKKMKEAEVAIKNAKATNIMPGRSVKTVRSGSNKSYGGFKVVDEATRMKNAEKFLQILSGG